MSEEEKKFKIRKIQKYTNEYSLEARTAALSATVLGGAALGCAASMIMLGSGDFQGIQVLKPLIMAVGSMGFSVASLAKMIEAISNKAVLKGKIEDLKDALEYADEEAIGEEKGRVI